MTRNLRALLILAACATQTWTSGAPAQDYPNAPIRLIVTFAAGGSSDVLARAVAKAMSECLGRTVVVEEESLDVPLISGGIKAYAPRIFGTPLLPGSSTLPGYYGTSHSYSYDGPYYGRPTYWNRLPYACGVYGYC